MKQCKTCIEIAEWQQVIIDTYHQDPYRQSEWKEKIMCSLQIVTWLKKEKAISKSRGKITTKPYLLKYCPTCGKKLDKRYLKKLLEEVGQ